MNTNKRMAAEAYDKIHAIPVYINEGREPYVGGEAGYLRFRKIYGGSDNVLLSNWMPAGGDRSRSLANLDDSTQDGTQNSPLKAV